LPADRLAIGIDRLEQADRLKEVEAVSFREQKLFYRRI
jgi:hypothetical protein